MAGLFLSGCGKDNTPHYSDLDLTGINLSPEMAAPVKAALSRLNQPDDPTQPGLRVMAQYDYLSHALHDIDPSAAADSMLTLWSEDPTNFFWIDLGLRLGNVLHKDPRFGNILNLPVLNDSTTAVGCFCEDRKYYPRKTNGQWWQKSLVLQEELTPLQKIWLNKWMTLLDRNTSQPDLGVRRILGLMETARSAGGLRLEFEIWTTITICLLSGDHLDDALHTAALAGIVATKVADPYLQAQTEYWLGRIFSARKELETAKDRYLRGFEIANRHGFNFQRKVCASRAGTALTGLGDYTEVLKLDRINMALMQATADSSNIPNGLMNLASTFRQMGQLDSCLVYQKEAIRCLKLHPHPANEARMPLLAARYYAQVGQYAQMDSLLQMAIDNPTVSLVVQEAIKLHVSLIESGLERGRPDLVHRSLAQVDSLRNLNPDSGGQIKVNYEADLVIADFYTRQNKFARAQLHLDRVAQTLANSDSPTSRWYLLRAQGLLARQRGDTQTALAAFQAGYEIMQEVSNPDLLANSRLLLGTALLDNRHYSQVLELFPPEGEQQQFGGRFRTRLASQLLRGLAYASEDNNQEAAHQFGVALEMCSPWSPVDLVARTHLELGSTLVELDQIPSASKHLHLAWELLLEMGHVQDTSLGQVFHNDLRRDTVEALISLYLAHPETSPRSDIAGATLNLWGHLAQNASQNDWEKGVKQNWIPGQLVFFTGNHQSYRWAVGNQTILVSVLPPTPELERLVLPILSDLGQPGRPLPTKLLGQLSQVLLDGVEPYWTQDQPLLLVCDGLLGSVPWAALPLPPSFGNDKGKPALLRGPLINYLTPVIEDNAQNQPSGARGRLLAVGANTSVQNQLSVLVHAEEEAQAISALWQPDSTTTLLGGKASWKNLMNLDLAAYNAIHLASHAKISQGLPEQSTLVFSGTGEQEKLTAYAVADLNLAAELVYLSSCEAAAGSGGGVVGSFVQAFLDAGAKTVIASNLGVDDEASSYLALAVFKHWLAGTTLPQSLRLGQLDLMEENAAWSHPFYWAFFRIYQ